MPPPTIVSCHVIQENSNFKETVFSSDLKRLMYSVRNVPQNLSSVVGTHESVWFEYIASACTH